MAELRPGCQSAHGDGKGGVRVATWLKTLTPQARLRFPCPHRGMSLGVEAGLPILVIFPIYPQRSLFPVSWLSSEGIYRGMGRGFGIFLLPSPVVKGGRAECLTAEASPTDAAHLQSSVWLFHAHEVIEKNKRRATV